VMVKDWFLSKYTSREARVFYVEPGRVMHKISPVLGNYPEAIRALTASEKDKARPLAELLAKSSFPWTAKSDRSKTVTFLTYLSNTLLVALLSVIGTLTSSSLVAYGLSRIQWRGRSTLFNLTLATMMVPFPVLMVPLYGVFRSLGWIGTLMPLWVPMFCGGAFNIFLLRQFFLTIPGELSDAARIDGCSEFGIFWRVILPLSRPALSVVALFTFLHAWNDFLGPLIFLTDPKTFTMALGLQQYRSQFGGSEWHLLMAASALLVMPIIVLFFFAQKTFIQGISTTGMGGR
jgi:multiple sugar transport system permease protein